MSTITTTDDIYQPTRLEDVKWRVGNRINALADSLHDRLSRVGHRLTGDGFHTLEEEARLNYQWGHDIATNKTVKTMVALADASRNGGQR